MSYICISCEKGFDLDQFYDELEECNRCNKPLCEACLDARVGTNSDGSCIKCQPVDPIPTFEMAKFKENKKDYFNKWIKDTEQWTCIDVYEIAFTNGKKVKIHGDGDINTIARTLRVLLQKRSNISPEDTLGKEIQDDLTRD